ncbi:MAG TPA: Nif3-like dinuclear metal center hexameric protein [Solirubrobacteraceae bacterium]|jgi:dinuclear metal center YbgI/SA1388 family protein
MPARTLEIVAEIDRLLEPGRFVDYGPNGLQVPGREEVSTLATGVSAHVELFEQAIESEADLLLVHHGLFWGSGAGPIDLAMKRRLKLLFDSDLALAAYHLPLDAHLEVGNNALIARALGAERLTPFALHKGQPIGCIGRLRERLNAAGSDGLFAEVARLTGQEPLVFDAGPEEVKTIAIVTGAGSDYMPEAIAAGADAFITGEPAERAMAIAREGGIHFIAAGHHATEVFGVRRLGEHLAKRFELRHVFLDVPNPI